MKQYPVNLKIEYSEKSNKLTALFRLVLIIPIILTLALIAPAEAFSIAIALMILFRENTQSGGLIGMSVLLNLSIELLPMGC